MAQVSVLSSKVIAAADAFLAKRDAEIKAQLEQMIASMMRERKFFLFGRRLTRDEAIARLKTERHFISVWNLVHLSGSGKASHIESLRRLALCNPHGHITLSRKDVDVLFPS